MNDKDVVLEKVSKGSTSSVKECWKELNDWMFAYTRLITLGVQPPDPSVQLRAVTKIASKLIEHSKEIEHRYYTFLVNAGISGGNVTQSQIDTLWKYLSAEALEYADAKPDKVEKAAAKLLRQQEQQ